MDQWANSTAFNYAGRGAWILGAVPGEFHTPPLPSITHIAGQRAYLAS